jgi:beta-lactamase regulating signal transducer with metallopeptidase domain
MHELLFPIAALTLTIFVLIPALTLVCHVVLESRRRRASSWMSFGSETVFAWLVAPVLLPILWLGSSVAHQAERLKAETMCMIEHVGVNACTDVLILLALIATGTITLVGYRAWSDRPSALPETLGEGHRLVGQVVDVMRSSDALRHVRFVVVRGSSSPIYTVGYIRPVVVLDACFVEGADPEMLRAALLHEWAHITGMDTLRCFMVRLCLCINPARVLLAPNFARWRSAREAACDGEAVHQGGEPLALAQGILQAARFECRGCGPHVAPLCGHDVAALKLRLALLMGTPTKPTKTRGHVALLLGVAGSLALPHVGGLELLDLFHIEVERLFHTSP